MNYTYQMSETFARFLLKNRKGDELKKQNQEFLCQYVNEQFGIRGNCIEVTTV
jgi:hypothetical protein